MLPPIMLTPSA